MVLDCDRRRFQTANSKRTAKRVFWEEMLSNVEYLPAQVLFSVDQFRTNARLDPGTAHGRAPAPGADGNHTVFGGPVLATSAPPPLPCPLFLSTSPGSKIP
jgi:hypothetical protein